MFFITECQNEHLGKTKLMKLIYFLDFDYYEHHGRLLTNDVYRKLPYGPVPMSATRILKKMEMCGDMVHTPPERKGKRHRFDPQRPPRAEVFGTGEYQVLRGVIERWCEASRGEIVRASHLESPWALTENYYDRVRTGLARDRQIILPHVPEHISTSSDHDSSGPSTTPSRYSRELTAFEQEILLECVITSESLEGNEISRARAKRIFKEALELPLVEI